MGGIDLLAQHVCCQGPQGQLPRWLYIRSIVPVTEKYLRRSPGKAWHGVAGTLHDLHTIDPQKKIEWGLGTLAWQHVEQGLEFVQTTFVQESAEFPNHRLKCRPIPLPPRRVAYIRGLPLSCDLKDTPATRCRLPTRSVYGE